MNFKSMKTALAGLMIVGLVFTACEGEDGEDGINGVNGMDGNANVVSNTYTVAGSDWSNGSATVSVAGLSEDIADNGSVAVFFTFDSLGTDTITWNALPYRFVGNVGGQATFITTSYSFNVGEVNLSNRASNNAPINFNNDTYIRVVLIENSNKVEGVDLENYEEVKMVYGLPESDL